MLDNKKAPTSAATLAGAAAETTTCRASFPVTNFTTPAAGRQMKVSDILSRGRENAVPLRHLTKVMDTDERTVRLMIERERRNGTPICADNASGYYLPSSEAEKSACARSMKHRAEEIRKTAEAIERAEV